MNLDSVFDLGKSVIERLWPDPIRRAEEMRKLEELRQTGDLARLDAHVKIMVAQIEVNREAAKSGSLFVAGARPFIIWTGGFSLAWAGILHPLLLWVWAFSGIEGTPPPMIDTGAIIGIVTGLLGVGTMRSYDKSKGVQTNRIGMIK